MTAGGVRSGYDSRARLIGLPILDSYAAVRDGLKSRVLQPANHEGESGPFVGGTLITLSGDQHLALRRLEAALFTKDALARYEIKVLTPVVERTLTPLRRSPDGSRPAADLVTLARTMLLQIAADVIGLDGVDTPARTDRLGFCMDRLIDGTHVEWSEGDRARIVQEAIVAKEAFDLEYVTPALQRRRGKPGGADLLSLLQQHEAELGLSHELILREAILYLVAATVTTSSLIVHTVDELDRWCAGRPDRLAHLASSDFLSLAAQEALRLHAPTTALVRRATAPVHVADLGLEADELVALDLGTSNRDASVVRGDAGSFDPGRPAPEGAPRYVHAFGGGPHICIGRPLALPTIVDEGVGAVGITVRILISLYQAGIRVDRRHEASRPPGSLDVYDAFPVSFLPA